MERTNSMSTTVDIPVMVDGGGGSRGSEDQSTEDARGARARVRARGPMVVTRAGRSVVRDVGASWVWHETPPALRDLMAARTDTSRAINDAPLLRIGWVVWNTVVAVPITAALYVLAWVIQHPARAGLAAVVVGAITYMWIK